MTTRINCPLCEWFHDDLGANPNSLHPMTLAGVFGPGVFAAHAIADHARKIEEILSAHFKTHTTVEWLRKVTAQAALIDVLVRERDYCLEHARGLHERYGMSICPACPSPAGAALPDKPQHSVMEPDDAPQPPLE